LHHVILWWRRCCCCPSQKHCPGCFSFLQGRRGFSGCSHGFGGNKPTRGNKGH
jgi:hypothetical protein